MNDTKIPAAKEENKKKNLYILIVFLCVLLIVVFVIKREDKGAEDKAKKKVVVTEKKAITLKITELLFEPEKPVTTSILRVIPVLKEKPRGKFSYKYRWFVNGEEIPSAKRSVLPQGYRKKNNRIYCRVKAVKDGVESKEKKSKTIVIANSPPVVKHSPVQGFSVPGDFRHQINAYDPDGDDIEFNLIAPLGMGIELNNHTGEIRWSIPAIPEEVEPEERVPQVEGEEGRVVIETEPKPEKPDRTKVLILIEVRDSDGAVIRTGINLDLKRGREIGM